MKKAACWLSSILLAVTTPSAQAGSGLNLSWDTCYGEGAGHNRSFACDTNVGEDSCVGSLVSPTTSSDITGVTLVVDFAVCSQEMPGWWQFYTGRTCRPFAMSLDWEPDWQWTTCQDAFAGSVGQISSYDSRYHDYFGHAWIRMTIQVASPAGEPLSLVTGSEYFAFRMTIDHSRSLGSNSCAGCTTPASIRFSSATLGHVDRVDKPISYPESYYSAAGSDHTPSNFISWQGGFCLTTRARNSTWGAVKALYR